VTSSAPQMADEAATTATTAAEDGLALAAAAVGRRASSLRGALRQLQETSLTLRPKPGRAVVLGSEGAAAAAAAAEDSPSHLPLLDVNSEG